MGKDEQQMDDAVSREDEIALSLSAAIIQLANAITRLAEVSGSNPGKEFFSNMEEYSIEIQNVLNILRDDKRDDKNDH